MEIRKPLQYIGSFVALDFETTGTDVERDTIIEIGAIKYENGVEVDRFHTLINPFMPLPAFITELTGITEEDLHSAPPFAQVIEPFWRFLEGFPIMAHNALFELKFLQKFLGAEFQPPLLDTVQLFQLLFPEHSSHSLEQCARQLGIDLGSGGQTHRALEDVELMLQAVERSIQLLMAPDRHQLIATVVAVADQLQPTKWQWQTLFRNLRRALALPAQPLIEGMPAQPTVHEEMERDKEPLDPVFFYLPALVQDLLQEWISAVVPVPVHFVETSKRARRVAQLLADRSGKQIFVATEPSWEWLLGAILGALAYAQDSNLPVCIAVPSAKKREDLYALLLSLKEHLRAEELHVEQLRQPAHFLCQRRLPAVLQHYHPAYDTPVADEFFGRLFLWLWGVHTRTGDVAELPPQLRNSEVVQHLLQTITLHTKECLRLQNPCFYGTYYHRAAHAHVLFADYWSLLDETLPDLQLLPTLRPAVVCIEAEALEDLLIAKNTLRVQWDQLHRLLQQLEAAAAEEFRAQLQNLRYFTEDVLKEWYADAKPQFVNYQVLSGGEVAEKWLERLRTFTADLQAVVGALPPADGDATVQPRHFALLAQYLEKLSIMLEQFQSTNYVNFVQLYRDGRCFLVSAQLQLTGSGNLLQRLWQQFRSAVISSSLFYHSEERHRLTQVLVGASDIPMQDMAVTSARQGRLIFTKGLPRASSEYFGEKIALLLHRLLPLIPDKAWVVAHQRSVLNQIYRLVHEVLGARLIYYGKTHRTLKTLRELLQTQQNGILLSTPLDFHALGYSFTGFRWVIYDRLPYIIPTPRTTALRQQWVEALDLPAEELTTKDWEAVEQPMMFRNFRKLFDFLSYGAHDRYTVMVLDPNLSSTTLAGYHRKLLEYLPKVKPQLEHYEQVITELAERENALSAP